MDFAPTEQEQRLRTQLRTLVREELPADWLSPFSNDPSRFELSQRFNRRLAEHGLLTMAWPAEHGGRDAGVEEQMIVREEMWASYEPRGSQYMGLNWAGPAIMKFGTDAQRARWLPQVAAGRLTWCQGFSEPEAGSDLASLRTTASATETGWTVNGQKIWTSYAATADLCVLAARTGSRESRHRGISIFLLPMDRAGITVRPVDSLFGPNHLNEVFLDDVALLPDDLLGEENQGWRIVRHILAHERVGIARYARVDRLLNEQRRALGAPAWEGLPSAVRVRFLRALVRARVARLLAFSVLSAQARDDVVDAEAAVARLVVTRLDQEAADVLMESAGAASTDPGASEHAYLAGAIEDFWRYSRASTVASGTAEVLRMVIFREVAKQVHG